MLNVVSEAGLYSLILRSRKPEAKVFKRWITHEVIPSIRKHGAYMTKSVLEQVMESPETVLMMAQRMLDEHRKNEELAKKLAVAQPKADYFDRFIDSGGCTNIRATAKELEIPERVFVSFLLDKRYLYRAPSGGLVPYAKSASDGLFVVKDFVARNGHQGVHTLVTTKDKELFYSLLGQMYC